MMLDYASHEITEWHDAVNIASSAPLLTENHSSRLKTETVRLVAGKLCIPPASAKIERQRLSDHLAKCLEQTAGTLVCGRAGAGKTTLAADFARQTERAVAWYTVEPADSDWNIFLKYLVACLDQHKLNWQQKELTDLIADMKNAGVAQITEAIAAWITVSATEMPMLIVLDDVHSVFDAPWFEEFFQSLVMSLTPDVQLLLLSRSQPSVPLWRMRSKQVLSVIEEDLLAFTLDEAVRFFDSFGLSSQAAAKAHNDSYGRAAKLAQICKSCVLQIV